MILLRRIKLNRKPRDAPVKLDTMYKELNPDKYSIRNLLKNDCKFCDKPLTINDELINFDVDYGKEDISNYRIDMCLIHKECKKHLTECSFPECVQLYDNNDIMNRCCMCNDMICSYHRYNFIVQDKNSKMCLWCFKHGREFRKWVLEHTKLNPDVIGYILDYFPVSDERFMFV